MSDLWPNHLRDIAERAEFWGGTALAEPDDEIGSNCPRPTMVQLDDHSDERSELNALIESARSLRSPSQGLLAAMLVDTVKRLVGDIVGQAPVDEVLLCQRAAALADLIGESVDPVLIAHPDDVALLASMATDVSLVPDVTLPRGTIQMCSATERAEDGVGPALRRLHDAIDAMGVGQ